MMFSRKRHGRKLSFSKKKDGLNFRRKRKKIDFNKIKIVFINLAEISAVILLSYAVVICFGKQVECSNVSMAPTYTTGDVLLVNTIAYRIKEPKTGDIIAFKPKSKVNASYSIKRVIGCPGDTVLISNGRLYVNGSIFKDTVDTDSIESAGIAGAEITLLDDQYFVLGDNRNSSEDSRYESIGFVSTNDILGKIWIKYPFK